MVELFLRFLKDVPGPGDTLYILGDLFEVWLGDDAGETDYPDILDALRTGTAQGTAVHVMRGNRDFLLGSGFARRTGCMLLPDAIVIPLPDEPTLLMHGDTLCTDDRDYQAFRRRVRNPAWQQNFLSRPLAERRRLADEYREASQTATREKPAEIMDVNAGTVEQAFRAHDVLRLIHGHTHKPGIHTYTIDGTSAQRIVLGDWYSRGSVLRYEAASGMRLETFG